MYKLNGSVTKFEDIVISTSRVVSWIEVDRSVDVFKPLFEVTKDPRTHPELHVFLQRVVGFDTVDDESKAERRIYKKFPYPRVWDTNQSPPYSYWLAIDSLLPFFMLMDFRLGCITCSQIWLV